MELGDNRTEGLVSGKRKNGSGLAAKDSGKSKKDPKMSKRSGLSRTGSKLIKKKGPDMSKYSVSIHFQSIDVFFPQSTVLNDDQNRFSCF